MFRKEIRQPTNTGVWTFTIDRATLEISVFVTDTAGWHSYGSGACAIIPPQSITKNLL